MVTEQAPQTEPARVLILIPTLNEAAHIADVLSQLLSDPYSRACRTVVADGGSTDGTNEIVSQLTAQYPNLELRANPDKIQAAAVNIALENSFKDMEILIRCDAHARYPAGFIADLVAELDQRQDAASIVIPMDAVATDDCFQRGLAWVADTPLGAGGSPHRGGVISGYVDHGHHAAFRLQMFRQVGGYDTGFVANEDAEYDRRVVLAGGRIWLAANIRIGYFPRQSARALFRQYWRYGIGRAQTCLKHRLRPAPRQMIPVAHVIILGLSLLILPFTNIGFIWPLIYGSLVAGTGCWIAVRKKSVCGLHAITAVFAMHFAWGCGFLAGVWRGIGQAGAE